MTKAQTLRAKMAATTAKLSTDQLIAGVIALAACEDVDRLVVRLALLNEYERREGGAAVDVLMNVAGL